jgi:large conductance mechanosensitive channel
MPILGILTGGIDFTGLSFGIGNVQIAYGNFIQAVISFLIIGWVVLLIVRAVNVIQRRFTREKAAEPVEPSAEVKLFTEIRDLLRAELE